MKLGHYTVQLDVIGRITAASLLLILGLHTPATAANRQQGAGPVQLFLPTNLKLPPHSFHIVTTAVLSQTIVVQFEDAILYTHDGTQSWHKLPLPYANPFTYDIIATIALRDSALPQPARILVTRNFHYRSESVAGDTIYRTGDFGLSWAQSSFPSEASCASPAGFYYLKTSPVDPKRLYTLYTCVQRDWNYGYDFKSYTSADGGLSWQALPFALLDLELSASSPTRIYDYGHGLDGELYLDVSNDAGQTWIRDTQVPGYFNLFAVIDAVLPDWIYSYEYKGDGKGEIRARRSEDFGKTWMPLNDPPCLFDFIVGGRPRVTNVQVVPQLGKAKMLFFRCQIDREPVTSDSNTGAIYRSTNGGETWQKVTSESGDWLATDAGNPGRLLWLKNDALWASTDEGTSWTQVSPQFHSCPNC